MLLKWVCLLAITLSLFGQDKRYGIGQPATPEEIARMDLTVFPNGKGLPKGSGTAERGRAIYKQKCAECHNENGEGRQGQYPALAGGRGTLASEHPLKTVGSYWPYSTTVFDYIRRAMPFDHPRSLSTDEVYSVSAFIFFLNGLLGEKQELNERNLAAIQMPNRNGFVLHTGSVIDKPKP